MSSKAFACVGVDRYRDVIVNMRAAPHMGLGEHIFEVQLHVRTFFDDQPNGGARILRMSDDLVGLSKLPLAQRRYLSSSRCSTGGTYCTCFVCRARELHVIRPPLLQLDPPEISVPALEPLAGASK